MVPYCTTGASTGTVWTVWNTGTTAASTTSAPTWNIWCEGTGSTTNTTMPTTAGVWYLWTNSSGSATAPIVMSYQPVPETAEQRKAREDESRKREKVRLEAEEKAKKLLLDNLDQEQAEQYKKEKKFRVTAPSGERYEFDCTKRMHNVHRIDQSGMKKTEYCIYLTGDCPLPDNHLAQKLLLEHDEPRFLKTANKRELVSSRNG